MTTTETALVIILIVELTLFFALTIVFVYFGIRIAQNVRTLSEKAVVVADNVEATAEAIKDASSKLAIVRLIQSLAELTQRNK